MHFHPHLENRRRNVLVVVGLVVIGRHRKAIGRRCVVRRRASRIGKRSDPGISRRQRTCVGNPGLRRRSPDFETAHNWTGSFKFQSRHGRVDNVHGRVDSGGFDDKLLVSLISIERNRVSLASMVNIDVEHVFNGVLDWV